MFDWKREVGISFEIVEFKVGEFWLYIVRLAGRW